MNFSRRKLWWLTLPLLIGLASFALRSSKGHISNSSRADPPEVILWAWERPESLDFVDPHRVAVAFLAKTIFLESDEVSMRPRLQPLKIPDGTRTIAVVRIEVDHKTHAALSATQLNKTAAEILELASLPNLSGLQIDFDARSSERQFYRDLLKELRQDYPPKLSLSITALASWCAGDNWISDLPVDEAVPMLFRMGPDRPQFEARLESGREFPVTLCQRSAGVSTDEIVAPPHVPRIYIFNPRPWTPLSVSNALEAYAR